MIGMSGKDIEIVYTGLRPGEKLHEELIGDHETDERPIHPKISHASIAPIRPEDLNKPGWDARCRNDPTNRPAEVEAAFAGTGIL